MKRKWLAIVGIAVLSINLCGCGGQESTTQTTDGKSVEAQTAGDVATAETTNKIVTTQETRIAYDDNDSDIASESVTATVKLNEDSITCDGENVKVDGTTATISGAGTYVLEGKLSDGSIVVDADKEDVVHLILNGVEIHSGNSAAIYAAKTEKCIITLAEVFFASTFWKKLQSIFGECCISKLEKVAKPRLAAILPAT